MEPLHTLEDLVPVDVAGLGQGDGGVGTVVDHLAGQLVGAVLQEVDAHAAGATLDLAHVHAEAAQLLDTLVANGVVGQHGAVLGVHAVVGQGHGHVGLAAAEGGLHHIALEKSLMAGGPQAQHDLAKSQDFHGMYLSS